MCFLIIKFRLFFSWRHSFFFAMQLESRVTFTLLSPQDKHSQSAASAETQTHTNLNIAGKVTKWKLPEMIGETCFM